MPKKKKHKWDVAISFAGENRVIAEELNKLLKTEGLSVFYDEDHKAYLWGKGESEFDKIYGPSSHYVVPIISEHYVKKDWPRYEFSSAVRESKKRKEEFILPVRVDDARLLGLREDINYMDIREDDVKQIAKALVAKCRATSGASKNKRTQNSRVIILPHSTRYALGIIATSVFPLELINLNSLFPKIAWQKEIRFLSRKGLVIKQKRSLKTSKAAKRALLNDAKDVEKFNHIWIKALEPFKDHTDTAIMLSLHYMHLERFDEVVAISANIVERMEPDWWCNLYLTLLKGMTNKKFFARLKPNTRIRLYNAMGLCLSHTGNNNQAIKWFLKLRRYSLSRKDKWGTGQSYINCGAVYQKSGNDKKAKACYVRAIKHARTVKDDLLLGHSLNNLAQIVVEDSFGDAEKLIKESITAKKHAKDYTGLVASYGTLGYLAAYSGKYEQARKWFSKSQKKAKALNLRYSESLSLFNLGNSCFDLGEFDNAYFYYQQSYEIAEKEGYAEIMEMDIEGEAKACFEMGRFRRAELKFRKLYDLKTKTNQKREILTALDGIGASLIKQGNMLEARKILRKTLKLARKSNDLDMIVKLSIYKALTYDKGKFDNATIKTLEQQAFNEQKSEEYFVALELWIRCIAELISSKDDVNHIEKVFENGKHCLKNLDKNYETKIRFYAYLHLWQWHRGNYQAGIETLKNIERVTIKGQLLTDQAKAIDQRGVCLQELRQLNEAELAHKKALKLARRIKDKTCIQTSLNNLGEAYRKTNRLKPAIKAFSEAERIARMIKDYESEISTAHNKALVLEAKGSIKESEQLLYKCRDRSRHLKLWGEYVRSWEALGNLAWHCKNQPLAIRRFRKALSEAKKHRQRELQPEIALNLARILLYQEKPKDGLQILKPYQGDFPYIIDSCEYYGTLAELYKEDGKLEPAKKNYMCAKESACRIGNKDRTAYFCAVLAEIHEKQKQPKLSDAELKQAIANEGDPEGLAFLLVQRFSLLLDNNREKTAKQVFHNVRSLITEHNFSDLYIDIHMILGDHNWKGNYKSKLNAMQAYIVALGESFLSNVDATAKIGSHIIEQLLRQPARMFENLIDDLEKDMTTWLLKQYGADNYTTKCLLWPIRVARKMFPYRLKPNQLKNAVNKIIAEETSAMFKKG